jgi:hypothetical protein
MDEDGRIVERFSLDGNLRRGDEFVTIYSLLVYDLALFARRGTKDTELFGTNER